MDDNNLKNQFKKMMDKEVADVPGFEDMWPSAARGKPSFSLFRLVAASIMIMLSLTVFLWINSRNADNGYAENLQKWESPTNHLMPRENPVVKTDGIMKWRSPTSSLLKTREINLNLIN